MQNERVIENLISHAYFFSMKIKTAFDKYSYCIPFFFPCPTNIKYKMPHTTEITIIPITDFYDI